MRTRHVYGHDMVAHLWAHQSQDSATTQNRTFYFIGDTIYSYGNHFPIARHVNGVVLFTTRGYSVTTAGHKGRVESACSHLRVFEVKDVRADHKEHLADYRARIKDEIVKYRRARQNKPYIVEYVQRLVNEANEYAKHFGLKTRFTAPTTETMLAECRKIEEQNKAREVQRARQEQKRQEERERQQREWEAQAELKRQQWVKGETDDYPDHYSAPICLRIKGDELQTSRGAIVPLDHAVKAFRVLKSLHDKGESYQRNGHTIHLGHFALDSLDNQGVVRAGCHTVEWAEIERVATLAGVN